MLKQAHFFKWKSFKEAELYIDSLTGLIGTNASGKSNALEGIVLITVHHTPVCIIPAISTVLQFFIKTAVKSMTNPFTKVNIVGNMEVWLTER